MVSRFRFEKVVIHAFLVVAAVAMVLPFFWMVSTSLKTEADVFAYPPTLIPNPVDTSHYTQAFSVMPLAQAMFNSLKVAVLATLGTMLTSSMAAYAFAKLRFTGRTAIFMAFLSTMMIPGQVLLIPLFIVFSNIGWIDTHWPLIVPGALLNAYGVFLVRQYMMSVPDAYVEAAKIDGANHLQIYWRLMVPLCRPAIITLGLLSFIGNWNNFLGPLIFLNSEENFTLPLIINSFRTVYYVQWGLLMAAACVAIVPVVALYLSAQRYLTEGIATTGLKG
jgi:multiple sugar transport system permease protein